MKYWEAKLAENCTYPNYRMPAQDDHCQCKRHAEDHRIRNLRSYHFRARQLDLSSFGIE